MGVHNPLDDRHTKTGPENPLGLFRLDTKKFNSPHEPLQNSKARNVARCYADRFLGAVARAIPQAPLFRAHSGYGADHCHRCLQTLENDDGTLPM